MSFLLHNQNTLQSTSSFLDGFLFAYQPFAEESIVEVTSRGQTAGEEEPPMEFTTASAERRAQHLHRQHLALAGYQKLCCDMGESWAMAQSVRIKRSNHLGCNTGIVLGQTVNQNSKFPITFTTTQHSVSQRSQSCARAPEQFQYRMFHGGITAMLLLRALVSSHKATHVGFLYRRTVLKLKLKYKTAAESFCNMRSKNTNSK